VRADGAVNQRRGIGRLEDTIKLHNTRTYGEEMPHPYGLRTAPAL